MRVGILLYIISSILFMVSCKEISTNEKIPLNTFAFIEQITNIKACQKNTDICIENSISSFASGVVIGIDYSYNTNQILTANHFCIDPEGNLQEAAKSFPTMTLNVVGFSFIMNDNFGNKYNATKISEDVINDLCLLEIYSQIEPIDISEDELQTNEHIINMAAPNAIWDPNAIIVFDGRFNGINKNNLSVYSIPAFPGSSGSPVLNSRGELAGIITLASQSGTVGYGATYSDMLEFISR